MQIYADVVCLINFVMDIFIFFIVSKVCRIKASFLRLISGASVMAALYCVLIFTKEFNIFYNIFGAMVILMVGVVISFNPKRLKQFATLILMSHIVAFSLGGIGFALYYFTDISNIVGNMVGFAVKDFPIKILIFSTCTFYILIKLCYGFINRTVINKQMFYTVRIHYAKNDVTFNALLDTGNTLRDPVSNSPVIIAEFNAVKGFLPDNVKVIFYENRENDLYLLAGTVTESDFWTRIRMIPFASIGKQNGMLCGFRPDKVEIINDDNVMILNNAIIGIYNFSLTSDGKYQGLLGAEAIS